jgi:hypothetical protein
MGNSTQNLHTVVVVVLRILYEEMIYGIHGVVRKVRDGVLAERQRPAGVRASIGMA